MAISEGKKWFIGITIALAGLAFPIYSFRVNLQLTKKIETVRLATQLAEGFYSGDPVFRDLRMSIERCEKLYKHWGGKFNNDQINRYLGFFDDLGFHAREGILEDSIIDHLFGAYIIEAYENNELRKYIELLQTNMRDKDAFSDFLALARKLEDIPSRKEMIELARRGCFDKSNRK